MKLGTQLAAGNIGAGRQFLALTARLDAIKTRLEEIENELEFHCVKVPEMIKRDLIEQESFLYQDLDMACYHMNRTLYEDEDESARDIEFREDLDQIKSRCKCISRLKDSLQNTLKVCRENNAKIMQEAYELRIERGYTRQLLGI